MIGAREIIAEYASSSGTVEVFTLTVKGLPMEPKFTYKDGEPREPERAFVPDNRKAKRKAASMAKAANKAYAKAAEARAKAAR